MTVPSEGRGLPGLIELREEIERIDNQLLDGVIRRIMVARRIGAAKRAAGLPLQDPDRGERVARRAATFARDNDIREEDVRSLVWSLIGLTRQADTPDS
ncbi:MAG: chorismate mutase [Gemmatimonadota bacterium]|nr:chorismate mutase [Gemmatimonadota bacterium]